MTRSGLGLCCGRTRSVADVVRSVPNLRSSFLRLVVAFGKGWVYILYVERLRACREFDEAVVICALETKVGVDALQLAARRTVAPLQQLVRQPQQ